MKGGVKQGGENGGLTVKQIDVHSGAQGVLVTEQCESPSLVSMPMYIIKFNQAVGNEIMSNCSYIPMELALGLFSSLQQKAKEVWGKGHITSTKTNQSSFWDQSTNIKIVGTTAICC